MLEKFVRGTKTKTHIKMLMRLKLDIFIVGLYKACAVGSNQINVKCMFFVCASSRV